MAEQKSSARCYLLSHSFSSCDRILAFRQAFCAQNFNLAMQEFIPNTESASTPPVSGPTPEPNRESVLITVVGSAAAIDLIIKILYRLGFAEVGAWSKPQTEPKSGRPMRILKKRIQY